MSEMATASGTVGMAGVFNLKDEHLLGHLEFHQVPEMRVLKEDMGILWDKHGLDKKFLPAKIHPIDAFRRATSAASASNILVRINDPSNPGTLIDHKARLMVREVKNDDLVIVRHLIRELVDDKNEILSYEHVASWRFDKKQKKVEYASTVTHANEYHYGSITASIAQLVTELLDYHTKDTVRNLITKVVKSSNPTPIMARSQGKFVPKGYYDTLKGLQALLADLEANYAGGADCSMDLIPIVNTLEQREIITRKATFALKEESEDLIVTFAETLKSQQEIQPNYAEKLIARALELRSRMTEYEQLLSVRLTVIDEQLNGFINQVRLAPVASSKSKE